MTDTADLLRRLDALERRVQELTDIVECSQLVAQYGPNVDSGSAGATAALWTEDGTFDAVGAITMQGHEQIAAMVESDGHQDLIVNGCGHVLTAPHVVIDGDVAHGRSHALNIRWDADAQRFWVARVSANSWTWERTPEGWRIADRVNANLDGTAAHRAVLAPIDDPTDR